MEAVRNPALMIGGRRQQDRRATGVQLGPVTSGQSRSLADTSARRSGQVEGRIGQIPKLTVQPEVVIADDHQCDGVSEPIGEQEVGQTTWTRRIQFILT
jgi:hypothetical protein